MDKSKRMIGLDILRILSMLGIIGLHLIGNGGVIYNLDVKSINFLFVLILYVLCFLSVDTFGILSGYLSFSKKNNKSKRIIELISIVFFYCVVITTITYFIKPNFLPQFDLISLEKSLFPMLFGQYWYITCYFLLFFLIPYINVFINKVNKNTLKKLLIIIFIFLSVIPNIFGQIDFFRVNNGYSPFWLAYCYMIGSYIGKYKEDIKIDKKMIITLISCFLCSYIFNYTIRYMKPIIIEKTLLQVFMKSSDVWFINYTSPFILIMSIIMVILFSRIKFKNINRILYKLIIYLSAASFAVYIIHCHHIIFHYILLDILKYVIEFNPLLLLITIIGYMTIIYIICATIDSLRRLLYKVLKIDTLIELLGNKLDKYINIKE